LDDESLANLQKNEPGDLVVFHFLKTETSESDNKLLSTSVLCPGGAIAGDAIPWQQTGPDIKDNVFIEENIWPLPKGSFAHSRGCGTFVKSIRMFVREQKQISILEAIRKTSLITA
jgi:N-acyl-D-glutamate deacylase